MGHASTSRPVVLLFAPSPSQLREMLRMARLLAGQYEPIVAIDTSSPAVFESMAATCADHGTRWIDFNQPTTWSPDGSVPAPHPIHVRPSMELARRLFPGFIHWPHYDVFFQLIRSADHCGRWALCLFRPVAIVVPEETVGHQFSPLIKLTRALGVPCLIVPYTISTEVECAESFLRHSSYEEYFSTGPFVNRLVARFLPQWVYRHQGHQVLRWLPSGILAHWWYGTSTARPWTYNDGHAGALAAESERMAELYVATGIPLSKIHVTGSLADDTVADIYAHRNERRQDYAAEANLSVAGKKLVVVALPPRLEARPTVFGGYDDMVRAMAGVGDPHEDTAVLLAIHPAMAAKDFAYLERETRARISTRSAAELVAVADVYVACASATIRQAITCGVPTVNVDGYAFHYPDFENVPGVVNVFAPDEFRSVCRSLLGERTVYAEQRAAIRGVAGRWGSSDGRSGRRILDLLGRMIRNSRGLPANDSILHARLPRVGNEHLQPLLDRLLTIADRLIEAPARWRPQLPHTLPLSERLAGLRSSLAAPLSLAPAGATVADRAKAVAGHVSLLSRAWSLGLIASGTLLATRVRERVLETARALVWPAHAVRESVALRGFRGATANAWDRACRVPLVSRAREHANARLRELLTPVRMVRQSIALRGFRGAVLHVLARWRTRS